MKHLVFLIAMAALAVAGRAAAAEKSKTPTVQDSNEMVEITATAYADKDSVVKLLGRDPGFPLIVIDVKFTPRLENKIALWRDDFTLLSNKDGQRSQPLSPSQLAGSGALVVSNRGYTPGSGMRTGSPGDTPLGYPDITGTGRPRVLTNEDQLTAGSAAGNTVSEQTAGKQKKEDPLLQVLKDRVLQEKETADVVTGHLYFVLDGKHKLKDLELIYKMPGGRRILLDFEK